jgi:hypothetical protein
LIAAWNISDFAGIHIEPASVRYQHLPVPRQKLHFHVIEPAENALSVGNVKQNPIEHGHVIQWKVRERGAITLIYNGSDVGSQVMQGFQTPR